MKRIAIVLTLVLTTLVAAPSARANDWRGAGSASPVSVFPVPRDPWRSWGVVHDLPQHVAPPRVHGRVFAEQVWVPQQWVWNGAAWGWWPGGWVR
jgi:hypothetical protein